MIRSFIVTVVTTVGLLAAAPSAAQPAAGPQPAPIPVSIAGGTPGVNMEFYLNAGKMADATVNTTGGADWLLDLSNMGKTKVTIYVDVCKDGKIVKVMFVTGNGQPPPKDEDCDRRLVAAGFQSDCGVTRITIDIRNFGSRVIGCANPFTRPQVYGPIAGGAVLLALLAGGGDGATTSSVTPTPVATPAPTPTPTPTPAPTPTPTPTPTPATFTVTLVMSFNHPSGSNFSFACGVITTNPTQPGATYTVNLSGPAVVPNQNISGTLTPNGQGAFQGRIQQVGTYTANVSVRSTTNVQSTASGTVNVGPQNATCPAAQ